LLYLVLNNTRITMSKYFPETNNITKLMLQDVAKTKVMTTDEEKSLFIEYNSTTDSVRKEQIKSQIIQSNLRFVLKVAIYYNRITGVDLNDLMNEGTLGLFNAFRKFDHTKNIKFISLAVWDIRCMISKFLEENDLVRVPAHLKMELNKLRKGINKGNIEEVDFNMEILLEQNSSPLSFDKKIGSGDDDFTLGDTLEDTSCENQEKKYYKNFINTELRNTIKTILTEEEKIVIEAMFGLNQYEYSINETEVLIGKSKERVRQIRDRALGKMKKHMDLANLHALMKSKT